MDFQKQVLILQSITSKIVFSCFPVKEGLCGIFQTLINNDNSVGEIGYLEKRKLLIFIDIERAEHFLVFRDVTKFFVSYQNFRIHLGL
jgi:hypothetical protein